MASNDEQDQVYIHWSAYCSLYSGKTRSYLIKKGLAFTECNPGNARFFAEIFAQSGFFSIPILECPGGAIVQDTTAIIEHLEAAHPGPQMQPDDPVLRAVCWLIHNYGTEGLFKQAQHYRWNFPEENHAFVTDELARGMVPADQRGTPAAKAIAGSFAAKKIAALPDIGVTDKTVPAIEQSTHKLFALLDAHFRLFPYILGGRPSVADCGLMTALHAHLGRDPYPLRMMKETAPALHRWTETMNRAGIVDPEFSDAAPEYFQSDDLPETLLGFLKLICEDFGPELTATIDAYHNWLSNDPQRPSGTLVSIEKTRALRQKIGAIEHKQQGIVVARDAWPDILIMHQIMSDIVDVMTPQDKAQFCETMSRIGGNSVATMQLKRRLQRSGPSIVLA